MILGEFRKYRRINLFALAFRGSLVFALAILVCSASPAWAARDGVKWENLAEHLANKSIPPQDVDVCDCPDNIKDLEPSCIVAQIIENTFYLWEEYDIPSGDGTPSMCIVMVKPKPGPLTKVESKTLLTASALWESAPPAPENFIVLDASDPAFDSLPIVKLVSDKELSAKMGDIAIDVGEDKGTSSIARRSGRKNKSLNEPKAQQNTILVPERVIGTDDRIRVSDTTIFPWNTICYLSNIDFPGDSNTWRGSACLVSPYMVLTCGHNVYKQETSSWANDATIAPGQYQPGPVQPYGTRDVFEFGTNTAYTDGGSFEHDYGAMFFVTPFDDISTFMPLGFAANLSVDDTLHMAGYPMVVQNETDSMAMWRASGSIVLLTSTLVQYTIDASGGNSGSPVWHESSDNRRIVAVHAGYEPGGLWLNQGPRLGSHNQSLITQWMQWTPPPDDYYEENDTLGTAYDLSAKEEIWLSSINGLGVQLDEDWFKIYVTPGDERVIVDCKFTHANGDIDIALYNSAGIKLDSSASTTDNEYIDYIVPNSGTHYVKVYYNNAGNTYDLWWDDLKPPEYSISGYVRTSGGSGISGVTMTGWPGIAPVTNSDGYYSGAVSYGWSGTVTPSKLGYDFSPLSRSYSNVTSDQANQDYTAIPITPAISGYVRTSGGSGISGVTMTGWPGTDPVTNSSGYYSGKVTYGWSGTITPNRTGYDFSPPSISYSNVTSDKLSENYTGTPITYNISGSVKTSDGLGISGVTMTGWLGTAPVTDGSGDYSGKVSYGWSGTIIPNKNDYTFNPPSRSYSNVISHQVNQDYTGKIPIIVPDVVGLTEAEAEAALNAVGLVKGVVTQEYSDTIPSGSIISQTPVARTSVAAGSPVDLVRSKGPHTPIVIYVDLDAQGANNGSSWFNAYTSLQDALAESFRGDEIRVAQGIYRPAGAYGARTATFQLKSGVAVKGSYAGFGQPDSDARDVNLYKSILSGDLNGNDGPNFANNDENSYHVLVTGSGTDETAVLDGFTITAGNANGTSDPNGEHGGGLFNEINSSPTIINCTFFANSAFKYGGGMTSDENSSPTVTNCTFSSNSAESSGGMHIDVNSSSKVINCTFTDNRAHSYGGGLLIYQGNPYLVNCTFTNNLAGQYGGGMFNWDDGNSTLTNCLFSGNAVENNYGGGIFDWDNSGSLTMNNCTFSGNSAVSGNTLARDSYQQQKPGNIEFANCILWDGVDEIRNYDFSTITITYSDVQGGWTGMGNIDTDPSFVDPGHWDPNGTPQDPEDDFWVDGDYHLLSSSPCIDAGNNTAVPPDANDIDGDGNKTEPIPWDLDRYPRIIGDEVDMGAYEFQGIIGDFCGEGSDQPDGYVDYWDLLYFAQRWHTRFGDPDWDPRCDLAKEDNYVDYWDLLVFAQQWHKGVKP